MRTEALPSELQISSPAQFRAVLAILAEMLKDGRLRPCQALPGSAAPIDVAVLASGEQWPDIVEAEFVDADGRHYKLFVDCYHGFGGTWRMSRDPRPT